MMVVNHVLNRIHVQRLLLAASFLGVSLSANAAFPRITQAGAGKTTTLSAGGANSGGSLLADVIARNPTSRADGAVVVGATGKASVAGVAVPVAVSGLVAKDAMAGAVSGALAGVRGGLPGVAVGAAVGAALPLTLNWINQAGVRINADTGDVEAKPANSPADGCATVPTSQYASYSLYKGKNPSSWCIQIGHTGPGSFFQEAVIEGGQCRVYIVCGDGYKFAVANWGSNFGDNVTTWVPLTAQQLADKLTGSTANPAPGVPQELDNAGSPAAVKDLAATGPASIAGPATVTINNIDNSVRTTTTTNNYSYSGSSITNTSTTTKTEETKADGTKTSSSTTTTTPGDTEPAKPKPEDVIVQCDKYPNSLGCADLDTPDADIPRSTKEVSFTAEDPFGGGKCPADVMASFRAIGNQSLKIVDWTTFCGMALPLRGLVLALASIMAFFIIMPGGVRE
ncbi:virulence factor TspB C-terminal domain-related protein [Variovorax sp. tm]|uniref:virulence factor TspB C-terminal domain-related protein n=1 Tax=Variovorax atrisoli TaxID=3394203 RepID=UPI003A809150